MAQTQEKNDEMEWLTVMMLAVGSFGALLALATAMLTSMWETTIAWLLEHEVLVSMTHSPVITIPHSGGAGLDTQRCFIAFAGLMLVLVAAASALRRSWARRREVG